MQSEIASLPSVISWGVASRALPSESVSGDMYVVKPIAEGYLLAVVDGLGHGEEAAAAAQRAAVTLMQHGNESVIALVRRCHQALVGTRGVAMSLATFNPADDSLTWLGIGNVEGLLLRTDPRTSRPMEAILLRSGVVGLELPQLRASVTTLAPGDLLVMATDGIRSGFAERLSAAQATQRLADQILADYRKSTDDALVLVARYLGGAPRP